MKVVLVSVNNFHNFNDSSLVGAPGNENASGGCNGKHPCNAGW